MTGLLNLALALTLRLRSVQTLDFGNNKDQEEGKDKGQELFGGQDSRFGPVGFHFPAVFGDCSKNYI